MSNITTYEEELNMRGKLIYTNTGVSMLPLLRPKRDLMVLEKKGEGRCKKYDAVLYKRDNGQYVIHRIIKVRKEDYVIAGDNCYGKEYGITDKHILAVLTKVIKDGKEISATDKKYRLYVHLWCDFFPIRAFILKVKAHWNNVKSRKDEK